MIKITIDYESFPQGLTYSGNTEELRLILKKNQNNKCCYCETSNIKGELEHFRPKNTNAYFWLVDDYENMLCACHDCNQQKGGKLPVKKKNSNSPR